MNEKPVHVREGVKKLKADVPSLAALDDNQVERLYRNWSDTYGAGWLALTPARQREFVGWAFTTPYITVVKEGPIQD